MGIVERFARWLLRDTQPLPAIRMAPYGKGVKREAYRAAWDDVRNTEAGKLIVHELHNNLAAELLALCPETTIEKIALWTAGHEATKKTLLGLCRQAMMGSRLNVEPPEDAKQKPQLGAVGDPERTIW